MSTVAPCTHATVITKHRARWAAVGAAIAISLGAGGIGLVRAAPSPSGASVFVGTDPCRIVDTRTGPDHVGPFGTLGPNGKITITATGDVGQCAGVKALPATATGLQLNVTAVGATAPTHFTIYPGAGTPPNSSSLNPVPGQPPVPNGVTVRLDAIKQFSLFNLAGNVDVIIDVVGYFTDDFEIGGDEIADLVWTPLTLLNGWESSTLWTSTAPAFAIDAQGTVRLRGSLSNTSGSLVHAFTLPPAARPSDTKFPVVYAYSGGQSILEVRSDGTALLWGSANLTFTSLEGAAFQP